jgi:hypothetical protein
MPASAAVRTGRLPALTLGDEVGRTAPGWDLEELCRWPPDAFAFTATVLADSGAYRCVVSPPPGCAWPPALASGESWEATLGSDAAAWARAAAEPDGVVPEVVSRLAADIDLGTQLQQLDRPEGWSVLVSLLRLHALADEACAGAGMETETPFGRRAAELIREGSSLSRLPADRLRVLPKLRPPSSGMTLRSLSHHVALDRSEVDARWVMAPPRHHDAAPDRLTLLLIPHPDKVRAADFVPVRGPLSNMDLSRYGFYEYQPEERFDSARALRLVESARRAAGRVDVVVLPEGALDESEVAPLQTALSAAGVPYLIAGVRQPATGDDLGGNYAHFGAGEFLAPPQHKHHRWCLDTAQVHQYHLGSALDPDRQWWEAIGLPRRGLTFISVMNKLAICPLVCEDLARPDPVTDVVRSVAPTLVVGLLLDGPQLATRWPARYASVLADDPGCSVLTLTALGMIRRSLPPGHSPSRAIALWKDPRRGLQEILLADDAEAVALTAHVRSTRAHTADGRIGNPVAELVLSGIEQIA